MRPVSPRVQEDDPIALSATAPAADESSLALFDADDEVTPPPKVTAAVAPPVVPPVVTEPPVHTSAPAPAAVREPEASASHFRSNLVAGIIAALCLLAVVQAYFLLSGPNEAAQVSAAAPSTGSVFIQSTPPGARILIGDQQRGTTPATLTLNPGQYNIRVINGDVEQVLPVQVRPGSSNSHSVLFGDQQSRAKLEVSSQPSGARVSVDGVLQGVTPLSLSNMAPGNHLVVLEGPGGASRQNVTLQAGVTASVVVNMAAAGSAAGWLSIDAPIEAQLFENGSLLGSSRSDRIMLPAGRHVIDVVNSALGVESTQTVQIPVGGVATIRLQVPPARVDINATPWADVSFNGTTLGTTPLGGVSIPVGTQELVFRHPQLGERRVPITVTLKGPNRVSVNMNGSSVGGTR